jgi:septum formation protein
MTDHLADENSTRLVLASSSLRRRQLMEEAGYRFEVISPSPDAESDALPGETASQLVLRLARQKAADVASRVPVGIVIGCDTVAECQGIILGKPVDHNDARRMLKLMDGRDHQVLTGLCLWQRPADKVLCQLATSSLVMETLSDKQLEDYLLTNKWEGKAAGFGYQDDLDWIRLVSGSESNVVGLPLELLNEMLHGLAPC